MRMSGWPCILLLAVGLEWRCAARFSIANYEDRFVILTSLPEQAEDAYGLRGSSVNSCPLSGKQVASHSTLRIRLGNLACLSADLRNLATSLRRLDDKDLLDTFRWNSLESVSL
jgi:hypothetical protein